MHSFAWLILLFFLSSSLLGGSRQETRGNSSPIITTGSNSTVSINYNFNSSQEYQDFVRRRALIEERIAKYPTITEFKEELRQLDQEMDGFRRSILKLAQDINAIPLNTKRLQQAKAYFDAGKFHEARVVLDEQAISKEQDELLAERERLGEQQSSIINSLNDKANEFVLRARLIAVDYSLGEQRIPKTRQSFDKALKSGRTPERLFWYALFLQENGFYVDAEKLYVEALKITRSLAEADPEHYLGDVGMMLNNLGNLLSLDPSRQEEARKYYSKALAIYTNLSRSSAEQQHHRANMAMILNNLGAIMAKDPLQRPKAEKIYAKALEIRRELATSPEAKSDMATTLNNLARVIADDPSRIEEAKRYHEESLGIYQALAKMKPAYRMQIVMIQNDLATLLARQNDLRAKGIYVSALEMSRILVKENPQANSVVLAMTLNNLGNLSAKESNGMQRALEYYTEALSVYQSLAKRDPVIFGPDIAMTLNNLGNIQAKMNDPKARTLYVQALDIYRKMSDRALYLPYVAMTLNNIATVDAKDPKTHADAIREYQEALDIRRQLFKGSDHYADDVAMTLTNLGGVLAHTQPKEGEKLYKEALEIRRGLMQSNPTMYQAVVATTLTNLGALVSEDPTRQLEAEKMYKEALILQRRLAESFPSLYRNDLAMTLNNLANVLARDSRRFDEAEALYLQALSTCEETPPSRLNRAMILDNFGLLLSKDPQHYEQAKYRYQGALEHYRLLAQSNRTYQADVATTLIHLASLLSEGKGDRHEIEALYKEGLGIQYTLAKENPSLYTGVLSQTLGMMALAYLRWGDSTHASTLLEESMGLLTPLVKQSPSVFGQQYNFTLQLLDYSKNQGVRSAH